MYKTAVYTLVNGGI